MEAQTISQSQIRSENQADSPPLNAGDRLSRAEFERRYQAHPEIKKAELIEGVVYVPAPTRVEQHGEPHGQIVTWSGVYTASTPGVRLAANATIRLDFENELQPDAFLQIKPEFGGQSTVSDDDYLEGPPDLIVEIAASSASYDLHDKKRVYARSGVRVYVAVQMYEERIDWFGLREGVYELLEADEQGVFRSDIFPGRWFEVEAFWAGDLVALLAALQKGLASPEHKAFVEQLQARSQT